MSRLFTAALVTLTLSSAAFAQQTQNKESFGSKYGVLSERNMFMRERQRPRPAGSNRDRDRPRTPDTPLQIERAFVLRGVAIEDDQLHAYLENSRTNAVARVSPGDTLASGRVLDIAIDAILYEADGRSAWVEIGQNLSGVRTAPSTSPTTSESAGGTTGAPAPLPSGGGSIEEKMRQRRLQQRGGR